MSKGIQDTPCKTCHGKGQETVKSTSWQFVDDRWRQVPVDVTVGCGTCFGSGWVEK